MRWELKTLKTLKTELQTENTELESENEQLKGLTNRLIKDNNYSREVLKDEGKAV